MGYSLLSPFDPWKHKLCTCPKKYSFNPYTGCGHRCVYCYATYIPNFFKVREKKNVFKRLEKELESLCERERFPLISMSNSSDPYQPVEKSKEITKRCLEIFRNFEVRLLVITKNNLVERDAKLLSELKCAIAISISNLSGRFELSAPKPEQRIRALKTLHDFGIPTILRLDPLMPWIRKEEWFEIIEKCSFVDHIVTSTLKLRFDSIQRILQISPELKGFIDRAYLQNGERIGNSIYLPKEERRKMLKAVEEKCKEFGISCGFCREGFPFRTKSCDGSHLIG